MIGLGLLARWWAQTLTLNNVGLYAAKNMNKQIAALDGNEFLVLLLWRPLQNDF